MIGGAGYLQRVTVGKKLTTTAETTCYSADVQFVQLAGIRAVNMDESSQNLTLSWYDTSTTTSFYMLFNTPVQSGSHVYIPFDDGFTLREGDEIRAQGTAADAFDVIVTVIETPGRLV